MRYEVQQKVGELQRPAQSSDLINALRAKWANPQSHASTFSRKPSQRVWGFNPGWVI